MTNDNTLSPQSPAAPEPHQPAEALTDGANAAARQRRPATTAPETTVWTGRTHWHHFLGRVILAVIGVVLSWWIISLLAARFNWTGKTALTIAAVLTLVVVALVGASILYRVVQHRYRLTEQRLFIERGILSQTIDQSELIRVDDVRVHKRLLDRLLNMGNVEIRSTDATDGAVTIVGIKNADQVAELVRNSMRTLRSKSLFIENL